LTSQKNDISTISLSLKISCHMRPLFSMPFRKKIPFHLVAVIVFLALIATAAGCFCRKAANPGSEPAENSPLGSMHWLLGEWQFPTAEGTFFENWRVLSDSAFGGYGFLVVEVDTVFSERIILRQSGRDLYYAVTAGSQNDGAEVAFALRQPIEQEYIFENPGHDFPQRIIYRKVHRDSLVARIEGTVQGTFRKEDFYFRRVE
jgi:hypothetical protein